MSFFKMFSSSSSTKKAAKQKEKENAHPPAHQDGGVRRPPAPAAPTGIAPPADDDSVFLDEEAEAAGIDVSQFRTGKHNRNLSISRSGRHKYKRQMRSSVITGELYSESSQSSSQSGGGSTTANGGSNNTRTSASNCRELPANRGLSASSSQPTAV